MVIECNTPDKLEYNFYPVSAGVVNFKVRAAHDAHIALTSGPSESEENMIEVFIGGWSNQKSVIRRNKQKPEKAEADTPDVLNGGEFRGFWIRWYEGVYTVGNENEAAAFLSWNDPQPFPINYVGVCTGWGAEGFWQIQGQSEFKTEDCLSYNFRPVTSGSVNISFKGPSNCHIALCSSKTEEKPLCELILGGWDNQASVIRYNKAQPDKIRVPTPNLMTTTNFTTFHISWNNGYVCVRKNNGNGAILIDGKDCANFNVTHIGVRTAWGATGSWRIQFGAGDANTIIPTRIGMSKESPSAPSAMGFVDRSGAGSGSPPCWVPSSGGQVPSDAVEGGIDGEPIFVARAQHEGALIPGKLVPSHACAYIAWGGGEHAHADYEVLCGGSGRWVRSEGGAVPPNAVPAGETEEGEPLFVGRANHEGTVTVGKVQPSHACCYIPYAGQELAFQDFEIYCC